MEDIHNRLFTLWNVTPRSGNGQEAPALSEWMPAVDITEDENGFTIKAELPEVKKEDVKITVENGLLTISGERRVEKEEKGRKYHRMERAYGSFVRTFQLPEEADSNKVNAQFKDGVLTLGVGRSEKARAKQIEVKIN